MKKVLFIIFILLISGGGVFAYFQMNYAHTPLALLMTSDSREVLKLSQKFMEDIQFKDFKTAGSHSLPEQIGKYNIPELIENVFQVKPEALDINNIEILSSEIDSSGRRARVKVKTDVKLLNSDELKHPELMLYWKKLPDDKWYMDLATSLK